MLAARLLVDMVSKGKEDVDRIAGERKRGSRGSIAVAMNDTSRHQLI